MTAARFSLPVVLLLALVTALAVALGLYIRYAVSENTLTAMSCDAGEASLRCLLRSLALQGARAAAFGLAALAAALWCLWRPNGWALGMTLVFGGLGLVLYNGGLAATAVTLGLLSLARLRQA